MRKHLIFYDGDCPLCNRAIRVILKFDRKRQFFFAPLQGKTAKASLKGSSLIEPPFDSLVLLQDWQSSKMRLLTHAKATLRIAWHLGGRFSLLGLLSFLPSTLFDLCYKMVAKRRYHLFTQTVKVNPEDHQDRFLD